MVKNPPANVGDALQKDKAAHTSILSWEIPWTEESCGLQSRGSQIVRHNLETKQQNCCFLLFISKCFIVTD